MGFWCWYVHLFCDGLGLGHMWRPSGREGAVGGVRPGHLGGRPNLKNLTISGTVKPL